MLEPGSGYAGFEVEYESAKRGRLARVALESDDEGELIKYENVNGDGGQKVVDVEAEADVEAGQL